MLNTLIIEKVVKKVILIAKDLCKLYGEEGGTKPHQALNGINLSIEENEFVTVMGPSGSGKTTLLNIMSGIDSLTSGEVLIYGENINKMKKNDIAAFRRKKLGFVFQDFNLLDSLTLEQNIILPLIFEDCKPEVMEKKASELMKLLNIYEIRNKYPYNVSGGEQQRTSICRALVNNPAVIFADEPTGSLDSKVSSLIMKSFCELNKKLNTAILMVTHDAVCASFSNRVIFIKDGRVNMEIVKRGDRKSFLDEIYNCLSMLGGEIIEA